MDKSMARQKVLEEIKRNIALNGHHIYAVAGGGNPHYAYTIGLRGRLGVELIIAGSYFYSLEELPGIINGAVAELTLKRSQDDDFYIESRGSFSLRKAHASWTTTLMLGVMDFYQTSEVRALQIVPDSAHWTIDVPNMKEAWNSGRAAAWRWLYEPWTYPVPLNSVAITNLRALRNERITEVVRWEEDEWEMFAGAGPDVPKDEIRVVPLGVLLAADDSLLPVLDLPTGKGLWRDAESEWHAWNKTR